MTFTVEQIEAEARELELSGKWPFASKCMLYFAAMKRREAESVHVTDAAVAAFMQTKPRRHTIEQLMAMPHDICRDLVRHGLINASEHMYPPSQPSTGVPDGWQLVPIELTDEMESAAERTCKGQCEFGGCFPTIWKYMLAAAPRSP